MPVLLVGVTAYRLKVLAVAPISFSSLRNRFRANLSYAPWRGCTKPGTLIWRATSYQPLLYQLFQVLVVQSVSERHSFHLVVYSTNGMMSSLRWRKGHQTAALRGALRSCLRRLCHEPAPPQRPRADPGAVRPPTAASKNPHRPPPSDLPPPIKERPVALDHHGGDRMEPMQQRITRRKAPPASAIRSRRAGRTWEYRAVAAGRRARPPDSPRPRRWRNRWSGSPDTSSGGAARPGAGRTLGRADHGRRAARGSPGFRGSRCTTTAARRRPSPYLRQPHAPVPALLWRDNVDPAFAMKDIATQCPGNQGTDQRA